MTRNQKSWVAIVIVIIIVVGWRIYGGGDQSGTIKIGGAFGLTGDASAWGEVARNAALLAIDDTNKNGGINGRRVELVVEDMRSASETSVSVVSKLLNIDKVAAIIGPSWLDVYQGAAPLVKDTNIVMITPDGGIEAINGTTLNKNVFSTWYRSDAKARLIVKHMADKGVRRLFVGFQNDSYYLDFLGRVKKYAAQFNVDIVGSELVNSGTGDMRTVVLKAKAVQPDAIMFAFYDEQGLLGFLRAHDQIVPGMPLYGDEIVNDFVTKEPYVGLLNGVKFFHAVNTAEKFTEEYKNKYGADPTFGAGPAYDAMMIVAKALRDNGVGADLNGYLRSTTFNTVSYGDMTFDELGGVKTANNQFILKTLKDGVVKEISW